MFRLTPADPTVTSLSLADGTLVPRSGSVVADVSAKRRKELVKAGVLVEELPTPAVFALTVGHVPEAPIGFVYDGPNPQIQVDGIGGLFMAASPRFDLTPAEQDLARTTAGVLRAVTRAHTKD